MLAIGGRAGCHTITLLRRTEVGRRKWKMRYRRQPRDAEGRNGILKKKLNWAEEGARERGEEEEGRGERNRTRRIERKKQRRRKDRDEDGAEGKLSWLVRNGGKSTLL